MHVSYYNNRQYESIVATVSKAVYLQHYLAQEPPSKISTKQSHWYPALYCSVSSLMETINYIAPLPIVYHEYVAISLNGIPIY